MCSPFLFKTAAEKPELTWVLCPAERGPATPFPAPAPGEDFTPLSPLFRVFVLVCWGGSGYYCLSFLGSLYGFGFFSLFVALLTRKTHLKRNTGLLLKKDSNKGKPQSVMEKGYLELWELSTYQRHVAKLLFWFSLTFYTEFFAPVFTVSLINSIKLGNFTWFLYKIINLIQSK